ncbi:MAG: hypothetical protein J6K52_06135 [Clostridia bacterium]|nr:hypothetical protein [Clostridia bacterium]
MSTVKIDYSNTVGKIKVMHAVNNGPVVTGKEQSRGNELSYKQARIPYARVHDASFFAGYGGEHTVDVHAIFPNFDADVNDPQSYDFACTDLYISQIINSGAKPFYRLGSKIEHEIKKYGTIMPKDFQKWAEICEHIIRHYTEGWANGYKYDIEYWEIWNEPDIDPDGATNKKCWSGTEADYIRFYIVSSRHLKACFPHLKIGGPASVGDEAFMERFLQAISKEGNVPLDFFSWHWYWTEPTDVSIKGSRIKRMLEKYGYGNVESILNEWNYVRDWTKEFVYTIKQIIGMKGAAFISACMSAGQNNPDIDMLMYYDARPGAFNGIWDFYTYEPLKGYYSFYMYANLYDLGTQAENSSDDENVYVVSATNGDKVGAMITYYTENDNENSKFVDIEISGKDMSGAKMYLLDENNTYTPYTKTVFIDNKLNIRMERNSILYIEA